jgi:hypothetical protein
MQGQEKSVLKRWQKICFYLSVHLSHKAVANPHIPLKIKTNTGVSAPSSMPRNPLPAFGKIMKS